MRIPYETWWPRTGWCPTAYTGPGISSGDSSSPPPAAAFATGSPDWPPRRRSSPCCPCRHWSSRWRARSATSPTSSTRARSTTSGSRCSTSRAACSDRPGGRQDHRPDAQRRARGWPVRRDLPRLRPGAVVRVPGAQRLHRHDHGDARTRRAPGHHPNACALVRALHPGPGHGHRRDPPDGRRPDPPGGVAAGRRGLPAEVLLARDRRDLHLLPGDALPPVRPGAHELALQPARSGVLLAGVGGGVLPPAVGADGDGRGTRGRSTGRSRPRSRSSCGSTSWRSRCSSAPPSTRRSTPSSRRRGRRARAAEAWAARWTSLQSCRRRATRPWAEALAPVAAGSPSPTAVAPRGGSSASACSPPWGSWSAPACSSTSTAMRTPTTTIRPTRSAWSTRSTTRPSRSARPGTATSHPSRTTPG